ncbi:MAG TPA: archease [Gemmatimonadaceae bacterium]|nr:archease [Gemmatimonadaceae bacterium]
MKATSRLTEHVGEWQLVLDADSCEELFAEAARVVGGAAGHASGEPGPWEPVALAAHDRATLLADWFNELIGRSEIAGRSYHEVRGLTVTDTASDVRLTTEVRGTPVPSWHSPLKAATYHGLALDRTGKRWTARVLLDV